MIKAGTTVGNNKKGIMFLAYKPFTEENDIGEPLNAKGWKFIDRILKTKDASLKEDCVVYYIFDRGATETDKEEKKEKLLKYIQDNEINSIITIGDYALSFLIGDKMGGRASSSTSILRWHGRCIPDQDLKVNIIPTFYPYEVTQKKIMSNDDKYTKRDKEEHNENAQVKKLSFVKSITHAVNLHKPFIHNYLNECSPILNEQEAIKALHSFMKSKIISFDYETTGIKPHREGQEIICIGISDGNIGCSMPMYDSDQFRNALKRLLTSRRVKKIAHNMKFEATWTKVFLGYDVVNWAEDPMIMTHILDNRTGVCGLKFQAYNKLGVIGYDADAEPYLKPTKSEKDEYGANAINKLKYIKEKYYNGIPAEDMEEYNEKANKLKDLIDKKAKALQKAIEKDKEDSIARETRLKKKYEDQLEDLTKNLNDPTIYENVLLYCAQDAHLTFHLWNSIVNIIRGDVDYTKAYDLFHDGALSLVDAEYKGIKIDMVQLHKNINQLDKDILVIEDFITSCKEASNWDREEDFNYKSTQQLSYLLYDKLNYPIKKYTTKGAPAADKECLEYIVSETNSEMVNKILEAKQLVKIRDTFLKGILKETIDGIMHPHFNLHTVASYRSSSADINFQNLSKHNPTACKYIRGVFVPRENSRIVELDYGQLEVRGNASLSEDPGLMADCCSDDSDMHRDTAIELFGLTREEWDNLDKKIAKSWRQVAKNKIVFPQFYGAGANSCTENVWTNLDDDMKKRLKAIGIKTKDHLRFHIIEIIHRFWNERFLTFKEWGDGMYAIYKKTGKLPLPSGFKCTDLINRRQAGNFPAQGGCFHLLLWSLIKLTDWLKKENMKSFIMGQIHDSIVFNMYEDEMDKIFEHAKYIMTEKIKDTYTWVKVPLVVEADIYPLNGSWEKKETDKEL